MKKTRRIVQFGFLALTLAAVFVFGANAEHWCPFGGVEALYTYATEGNMLCSLGVSNFYILGGVVLMTVLLRRAFCGYMCPLGTISESLHALGRRVGLPAAEIPHRADRLLACFKYLVLGLILFFTWRAGELLFRGYDPCYALISRHGTDITYWAYVVSAAIIVVSLVIRLPFCRWFCPLAAVLHPFSRFGLCRIKRNPEVCCDCGLCAKACPMAIPVDQLPQVTAARCTSCMNCVEGCPQKDSGALNWGPPDRLARKWPQGVLVSVLLLCTAGAVAGAYVFPIPSFIKQNDVSPPARIATLPLRINGVRCRGRANLLFYFLERDDMFELPGYLKVEAWPGPGTAEVRIGYDPTENNDKAIKQAITEPYYDVLADRWRESPFAIEGYDSLGLAPDPAVPTPPLAP